MLIDSLVPRASLCCKRKAKKFIFRKLLWGGGCNSKSTFKIVTCSSGLIRVRRNDYQMAGFAMELNSINHTITNCVSNTNFSAANH